MSSFGSIGSQSNAAIKHEQFFSGLLWDADSQLYYARARWYEPVSGKFLSEDPIGFEGGDVNVSRYSGNDPVNNVDRSGLSSLFHVTNLGVNHASVFSNPDASPSQRFGVGLNLAVGTADPLGLRKGGWQASGNADGKAQRSSDPVLDALFTAEPSGFIEAMM